MKEIRFFYVPDAANRSELPDDEAQHALRVLRLAQGEELMLMDGAGSFYKAEITEATKRNCFYRITEVMPQPRQWIPHLHIAMAPTKNMDRTEWMAEKSTEIGLDEISFLNCKFSERKVIKTERIEKIVVSAVKQSHKAYMPKVNEMIPFMQFIKQPFEGQKFICHCYGEDNEVSLGTKLLLKDAIQSGKDILVLVGPEGDFSIDEVLSAEAAGFQSVSLGESRLRTETAALAAVHIMNLFC